MESFLKPVRCAGFLLALLFFCLAPGPALADERRVVRVGYAEGSASVIENEDGSHSGYLVDYLDALSEYSGWEYEYVCYDDLNSLIDAAADGDIDLIGLLRQTDARAQRLLFSRLQITNEYTLLCAGRDSGLYYQDYSMMDGLSVGLVRGGIHEESLLEYRRETGLNLTPVYYGSDSAALEALRSGEVELAAISNIFDHQDLTIVDRFGLKRAYFTSGMQNAGLMAELDSAMQQLLIDYPDIGTELYYRHYEEEYSGDGSSGLLLTREEHNYIEAAGKIVVLGFERRPLGYDTEGGFGGVLSDYMNLLGSVSGLEFVHEKTTVSSLEEHAALMAHGDYALIYVETDVGALGLDLAVTEPLFESGLSYIRHKDDAQDTGRDDYTFALISEMAYLEELLMSQSENFNIVWYESAAECMEAIILGGADMTIQDQHVATYLLQKPKYADNLVEVAGAEKTDGLCLYAGPNETTLIQILNKTMAYLGEETRSNFLADSMVRHSYEYTFNDLIYEYGFWIVLCAVLFAVIIALFMMYIARLDRLRAQKKENEELQERLRQDELTGLCSRSWFFETARGMIDSAQDELCIVRLNVRNFKMMNDLYGWEKCNYLLREIGSGLTELMTKADFIAGRFTADHFYLCIRQQDFDSFAFPRQSPAPWLGTDIMMSYGVYPVEQKELPVNIMCDRADMANSSQASGSDYIRWYSDEERRRILREQEIESEMERAIAERQFCIYIQPKFDIETEAVIGGEALVRWIHPQKGMISPGEFIGVFEKNGFIKQLDYYVWEECCAFLAAAKEKGLKTLKLSTNVSRIHFYDRGLQEKLEQLLEKYGLLPGDLELEITETICAEDPSQIFDRCRQLREAGFHIAMDDFGSGYSSLNMLREMPLDVIKMDLRFLAGDEDEVQRRKGENILQSLIKLAHTLEFDVVVEGVETAEQRDFIREIGNCAAQGYFFSRPIDCESYEKLLAAVVSEK